MLKQGVHPKIVQERLGHSSIQVTFDTYSHVAPSLQEAVAERFDELWSQSLQTIQLSTSSKLKMAADLKAYSLFRETFEEYISIIKAR